MKSMIDEEYGFGGLLTLDAGTTEKANELMEMMQKENLGYLAVSLGFIKPYSPAQENQLHLKFRKKNVLPSVFPMD
jgi:hypothetical protein